MLLQTFICCWKWGWQIPIQTAILSNYGTVIDHVRTISFYWCIFIASITIDQVKSWTWKIVIARRSASRKKEKYSMPTPIHFYFHRKLIDKILYVVPCSLIYIYWRRPPLVRKFRVFPNDLYSSLSSKTRSQSSFLCHHLATLLQTFKMS